MLLVMFVTDIQQLFQTCCRFPDCPWPPCARMLTWWCRMRPTTASAQNIVEHIPSRTARL